MSLLFKQGLNFGETLLRETQHALQHNDVFSQMSSRQKITWLSKPCECSLRRNKTEEKKTNISDISFFCSILFQIRWMPYVCNLPIMIFSLMYMKLRDHYNVGLTLQSCSICLYLFNYMVTCECSI